MKNSMISLGICLSDIPKDKIKKANNGKLYLDIGIFGRKDGADQYGNDVYAIINQSKEEREGKEDRVFIGNGKTITFNEPVSEMAATTAADYDDLPF